MTFGSLVNYLWFALILMGLVLVHEAGHMVVAKWCGMRVERFSVFFGRPLASFQRGETEYAIGWLPLGGYVKISGMTVGEDIPSEVAHRAYSAKPAWRKIVTILAGPAVNIVLAIIIFAAIFWIGVPTFSNTTKVDSVLKGSAAAAVGLKPGDRLLAVDEVRAKGDANAVRAELQSHSPGDVVHLRIARDGKVIARNARLQALTDLAGQPVKGADGRTLGALGFTFGVLQGPTQRYGPVAGARQGLDFTWFILKTNVDVIGHAFTSSKARDQVSSIVGVGAAFNDQVAGQGFITVLRFVGVISLALGIFNLIPILPLDGGHILFAVLEKVKGSAFSAVTYGRASFVGLAIVMLVFVIALQNDIGRLTGEGFQAGR
jgi:regulator of sigma E protease